jgi:hypothetical protein
VPWCERCDRFLNPNTVATDGTCPSCGRPVDPVERTDVFQEVSVSDERTTTDEIGAEQDLGDAADEDRVRAPWHFWLMIALVGAYLGWRLVQGIFFAASNWF